MRAGARGRKVVFPAIFGALALIFLFIAAVSPTGSWGIAAVAGLMPVAVVLAVGISAGFLCWAGVTILAFLLLPDKLMALLFGVLFGLYPIVKGLIERLRRLPLEYLLKLAFFNVSLTVIYLTMHTAVLASLPEAFSAAVWVMYLAGNVIFLVYDYGLTKLIALYMTRIHKRAR